MKIKVCGMRDGENIRQVSCLGIDYMGLIFYGRSPRAVSGSPSYLPSGIKLTGVFVDASYGDICDRVKEFGLSAVQLHGDETPGFCREIKSLGVEVIKGVRVAQVSDFEVAALYEGACDYLLFDTACSGYGGSGKRFDWGLLADYSGSVPFFLSGGIVLESVTDILSFRHPQFAGIDINSGFEKAPAVKDAAKVKEFINSLKIKDNGE